MGYLDKIFNPSGGGIGGHLKDAGQHYIDALRFKGSPSDDLYRANWHFTQAHPGSQATKYVVEDKWGIENPQEWMGDAGATIGSIWGPIGGAIGGAAGGWGGTSQFGEEGDYKKAYDRAGKGALKGAIAGYLTGGDGLEGMSGADWADKGVSLAGTTGMLGGSGNVATQQGGGAASTAFGGGYGGGRSSAYNMMLMDMLADGGSDPYGLYYG